MTHTSTIFLVLRRLRTPLIVLITLFAVSVLGLTLMPGPPDPNGGQMPRISFFHAVYFISYTATTIGFGEIPYAFSEQQRLWTVVCIYMSVVGWAYTLGTVFAMLQDKNFLSALAVQRFARQVRRLREPFFLVCGYGEAGHLICQGLDELGYRAVVLEKDEGRLGDLELQSYQADMPALCADASQPDTLLLAGLTNRHCRGDQLQVGHQAGGQVDRADLGAVAELEHGGDQVDHHRGEQLVDLVVGRVVDLADEEAEVERGGEDDEETEDDFFEVHHRALKGVRFVNPSTGPLASLLRWRRKNRLSAGRAVMAV